MTPDKRPRKNSDPEIVPGKPMSPEKSPKKNDPGKVPGKIMTPEKSPEK